jgi:MEMO1 family protein
MEDTSSPPAPAPETFPLPDKPCLRPLEAYPVDNPQPDPTAPKLLQLRDPSGLAPGTVTLPPLGAAVLQFCDGTSTRQEILELFKGRFHRDLSAATLDAMLARLDEALLLDSERFKAHATALFRDFAQADARAPLHAGRAYPAEPAALRALIEGCFLPPNGPGLPEADAARREDAPPAPRAILVPHSEFARGGPAYAWAYRPLLRARALPSLIVVLGTDHASLDPTFTLTRKHFDTPLGRVETDTELVAELLGDAAAVAPVLPELLTKDEHRHRGEASLELQMVWLRWLLDRRGEAGAVAPKVLPILCGSLDDFVDGTQPPEHADPAAVGLPRSMFGPFLRVLKERLAKRAQDGGVLWLCSAELAHVGPRFGDKEALSGDDHDSLEQRDKATLRAVLAGDAAAWLGEIRRERNGRRVSGLSAIYTMLQAADPPLQDGSLRCYAQVQAEAGSAISIASVVF